MLFVGRLATVAATAGLVSVAAEAGWRLEFDSSRMLLTGRERLPALTFRATGPHEVEGIGRLGAWVLD
ncbi:MAG: hypothetical protein AB7G10_05940 [Reyranellaceae bacterium]